MTIPQTVSLPSLLDYMVKTKCLFKRMITSLPRSPAYTRKESELMGERKQNNYTHLVIVQTLLKS